MSLDVIDFTFAKKVYKNPQEFEFTSRLEANWQIIRQELEQVNQRDFISWPEKHLYGKGWDIFGLYAFGMKLGKNCAICPETTKLVETIPGMVTAGFSSLLPGTHIDAHTGYPDGVLRCHLGLIGCDGCSLRVGDRIQPWTAGKCLVFDDTTEHEAWNRGDHTRIVLLLDFKYPLREPAETVSSSGFWQTMKQKLFQSALCNAAANKANTIHWKD